MVAKVRTVAFHGVEVIEVETQVTIASGLPAFTVVGLPDKAVAESRERVRAALGGAAGLLAGIGALAMPGVGSVVAAGALAATLAGAGVGAAVGGLVGAMVEAGIPREHADIYAEAVRRGGTLVTVRTDDAFSDLVMDILNRHSPVDIEERTESWRQAGWRDFDERAEPYAGPSPLDRPAATS